MKTATKKLPKKVSEYIAHNCALNSFGCISLAGLRASTGTRLSKEELKKRIDFALGTDVEFILPPPYKPIKIKTIDVQAKEWFDKVNGNSYFAAIVTVNYGLKNEVSIKK